MRKQDWQIKLLSTIEAAMKRPFCWGETDCCLFVADCCVAVCGIDPAVEYRGKYDSEASAKKLLNELGSISDALSAHFQTVPIELAQRGDAVIFNGDNGLSAGVLWAGKIWTTGEHGVGVVAAVPIAAWRVE